MWQIKKDQNKKMKLLSQGMASEYNPNTLTMLSFHWLVVKQ